MDEKKSVSSAQVGQKKLFSVLFIKDGDERVAILKNGSWADTIDIFTGIASAAA